MKRFTIFAMFVAMVLSVSAQYKMHVWEHGVKTTFVVSTVDSVTFENYLDDSEDSEEDTYEGIGVFSVSATKQVTFSPGNLQYTQSTNTWSFAENQWEMLGTDNVTGGSVSSDPLYGDGKEGTALADKVDLFSWSTSANNFGVSTSPGYNDYSGSFVDWGTNKIGNDAPNTWRTLSKDEWEYLLNGRNNATSLCGVAQVNGVNGLIFLPDNWTCPAGVTFTSGFHSKYSVEAYGQYQTFSADQWSLLESAGAVFLPAAGNRYGSNVHNVQYSGYYWSATEDDSYYAHCLFFGSGGAFKYNIIRNFGLRVRLVKDVEGEPVDPGLGIDTVELYQSIGIFTVGEGKAISFSPGNLQYHPANNVWQFAENQTDYIGNANANISSTYNGWLDLFGWSTAATNFGVSTSIDDNDYSGSFVDWGTNKIGNDAPNTWRTLSKDEWNYLFVIRTNASLLHGVAQINGVNGIVVLPDNWTCPEGIVFKSGSYSNRVTDYSVYQSFNQEQWSWMEARGAIFLPASGNRVGRDVYVVEDVGYYWSSTRNSDYGAYNINLYSLGVTPQDRSNSRYPGFSVRLVKDVK